MDLIDFGNTSLWDWFPERYWSGPYPPLLCIRRAGAKRGRMRVAVIATWRYSSGGDSGVWNCLSVVVFGWLFTFFVFDIVTDFTTQRTPTTDRRWCHTTCSRCHRPTMITFICENWSELHNEYWVFWKKNIDASSIMRIYKKILKHSITDKRMTSSNHSLKT